MALVDYSESEGSESETEWPAARPAPKKRVVDHRGKIIVNLPPPASSSSSNQKSPSSPPPAKRARTSGSGLFSGFNSLLPPPKKTTRPVALKTSAEPGFDRGAENGSPAAVDAVAPAEASESSPQPQPSSQEKPARAEPMGKPTMFKPLSVARSAHKKKTKIVNATATAAKGGDILAPPAPPIPTPKKRSLFSLHTEIEASAPKTEASTMEYSTAPLSDNAPASAPAAEPPDDDPPPYYEREPHRLDTIANDLNLSAAARRELFGRNASANAAQPVINYNMDDEYQRNEQLRAAGEQQIHNPVRAIQGGKHNLRQLVQNVQSQRDALEDSFAQGKSNRKDAGSRYGWR
ncbi:hypothetical protein CP533_4576 [Ophiocordyceps camponoti-saundersi (nom. inval.)]|nr:hypothetical protein CP533_4576 [Ophiocordyceps camponoti-saundersi (nom. inval.)]